MEPRLNVKVAELFTALAEEPQNPGMLRDLLDPMPGDYMDPNSDHTPQLRQIEDSWRSDWAGEIDRDNAQGHAHASDVSPASDPVPMAMNPSLVKSPDLSQVPATTASKLEKQVQGFNTAQARPDFTMGVVANLKNNSLVQSRVVVETPTTKIAGTVIAVGDSEFAVVWDDRTASVERKADYELVVAE